MGNVAEDEAIEEAFAADKIEGIVETVAEDEAAEEAAAAETIETVVETVAEDEAAEEAAADETIETIAERPWRRTRRADPARRADPTTRRTPAGRFDFLLGPDASGWRRRTFVRVGWTYVRSRHAWRWASC